MKFSHDGTGFNRASDYYEAVAWDWLSGCGTHSKKLLLETLSSMTDQDLAKDCWAEWFVAEGKDEDYDLGMLVEAFTATRDGTTDNALALEVLHDK